MLIEHLFIRDEVYPSWYVNALGRFLSLGAFGFTITKQDDTHIQVVAGADEDAAVVAVAGRWRWVEATISRAHPGGLAGTYDVYVTAADNNIVGVPAPYTDLTNYAFALSIQAAGATPAIVAGTVDIYRKVGTLQWDGAKITRIDQSVPAIRLHAHTHATGQADPIAPADIGAVAVGGDTTLHSLEITGAGTALVVDHDAAIDGALTVGGNALVDGTLTVGGQSTFEALATAQAGLTLDAGAGTVGQTLTLTGRNAGVASSATLAVSTAGGLTYNVPAGQSHAFNVAGVQAAALSGAALQIPTGSQYQIGSDSNLYRIAASNAGVTSLVSDNTGFRLGGFGIRSSADNDIKLRSNYLPAPDRLKTTSMTSWSLALGDGVTDDLHVSYTAATAGAPTYTKFLVVSNAGQLQLPITGAAGGLLIGGDATLYRNASNALRTGGALTVDGSTTLSGTLGVTGAATLSGGAAVTGALSATTDITARSGAATAVAIGAVGSGGASGITFQGSEANSSIYRSGVGAITSPASWTLSGAATALTVTNNATLGTLTVTGVSTLAGINASGALHLTGAGTALTVDNNATVTGVLTITGGATAPTRTPGDNTTNVATTAFVTNAVAGVSTAKAIREIAVLAYDDQTAPNAAGSVMGSIPVALAAGQTAKLLGVKYKCTTVGGTPSVFKIQTDHAVHGTLADVTGLTALQPATGAYQATTLGTAQTLSDGDEVAIVFPTPGGSTGCKVALVLEYDF